MYEDKVNPENNYSLKIHLREEYDRLLKRKHGMVEYLNLKTSQEDWHGVADAAMDIREIESKIKTIDDIYKKL